MSFCVPPLAITPARLTSSTAAEPSAANNEQAWASGPTYAIYDYVILGAVAATATISNATPAVITPATNNYLPESTQIVFSTTGSLPTGLTVGTVYYARNVNLSTGTYQVSDTENGQPIATSSAGSGTHTATAHIHRKYQSLQGSNTAKHPLAAASSAWWADIGPTNQYSMLDLLRSTATAFTGTLTVVITPGVRINSVVLAGLTNVNSARVQMTSAGAGGSVYDTGTVSLNTRNLTGFWSWFFERFTTRPSYVKTDLPPYTDGVITITLVATTGTGYCGACIVGTAVSLGLNAEYGAIADADNYSRVAVDDYGNTTLTPRKHVPKNTIKTFLPKASVNRIKQLREDLNAVVAVWSGLDDTSDGYGDALLIIGYYTNFAIGLDQPSHAVLNIAVKEIS